MDLEKEMIKRISNWDFKNRFDNENSKQLLEIGFREGFKQVAQLLQEIKNIIWCENNLSVTHFRNGDEIFHAKTAHEFYKAGKSGKAAFCQYNNSSENGIKYGKLYNWYAVNDPRGLATDGYHIPTDEEMNNFENAPNALPGGYSYGGSFNYVGSNGAWWSATESGGDAWYRVLYYPEARVDRSTHSKSYGFSVRCVKN